MNFLDCLNLHGKSLNKSLLEKLTDVEAVKRFDKALLKEEEAIRKVILAHPLAKDLRGKPPVKTQAEEVKPEKIVEPPASEEAEKPEKSKEPWEMTLSEYESIHGKPSKGATSYTENTFHKNAVHTAINQGKPVPESVLKDYPELQKSEKPPRKPRKQAEPGKNIRTMRGYIKFLGGINFLNFKGELKNMPLEVKYLQNKKTGVPIDNLVDQLIEDAWLDPGTSVSDFLEMLRTDYKTILSRDRLTVDVADKKEYQKSEKEKQFEKELAREPEEPPKGEYIQVNAEDLPEGKKLTLIEGKSADGWDVYEVTEKDPFSITLKDGVEIELKPMDRVEVLKSDLPKKEKSAESVAAPILKAETVGKKYGSSLLAEWVSDRVMSGTNITWKDLFSKADDFFGGTQAEGEYVGRDAYDAMELGINMAILKSQGSLAEKASVAANDAKILKGFLELIPTQTKRTTEQQEFQQFSTPPPLAYMANWVANIQNGETYLEPSAGTGGLAVFGKIEGAEVVVNELSPRRLALIDLLGFTEKYSEDAEQLDNILPESVKPTVIVMNPPFSATAGRLKNNQTKYGGRHVEQALHRLEPNGRLVAIVGKGMAMDAPAHAKWWRKIKSKYNVRANIRVSGKEYAKYGTTFDNRLLVIDKTEKKDYSIIQGRVEKVEELPALLEDVRKDRYAWKTEEKEAQDGSKLEGSPEGKPAPPQPTRQETAEPSQGVRPGLPDTPDTTVGLGSKTGEGGTGSAGVQPGQPIGISTRSEQPTKSGEGVETGRDAETGRPSETGRGSGAKVSRTDDGKSGLKVKSKKKTKRKSKISDSLYENYAPRVTVEGAQPHPTPLVESAAMADTTSPETDYIPDIPIEVIESGKISNIQLEQAVYSGAAHEKILPNGERRGYFDGDGTGVGKGRTIAAILWDNWRRGRTKAVWLSEKFSLFKDAQRDIGQAGWGDGVKKLFKISGTKLGNKVQAKEGIMFGTYSTLGSGFNKLNEAEEKSLSDMTIRLNQMVDWFGKDYDGVIVFDESHNMGNAVPVRGKRGMKKPAQMAMAGVELQKLLPNARVVYMSATGATEVNNLTYARRLGLWGKGTSFSNATKFIGEVESGGLIAMELLARDMKSQGSYLARTLSYEGVEHQRLEHKLNNSERKMYDILSSAWQTILQNINEAVAETQSKAKMSIFWGAHQRFFQSVVVSMQTPSVIKHARKQIENGEAVVIQLVDTGEAQQNRGFDSMEEGQDYEDIDFTPRENMVNYLRNSFPVQQYEKYLDEDGKERSRPVFDSAGEPVLNRQAVARRERLIAEVSSIKVPPSPLDRLIEAFGADNVAEVTGRSRRLARNEEGELVLKKRSDSVLKQEIQDFEDDKRKILIFSGKGGTGASYHADRTFKNQRRRNHYLLQPGWRADKAIQGLGRSHRSNQAVAPKFYLVSTDLEGQKRFLSTIARRLDQLGSLTKGQRQTGSQGIFQARDNLENTYARNALVRMFEDLDAGNIEGIDVEEYERQTGLSLRNSDGDFTPPSMRQFLNRLLSMNIPFQNIVFDNFTKKLDSIVQAAAENGTLDVGVETITGVDVKKVKEETIHTDKESGAETKYVSIDVTNKTEKITFSDSADVFFKKSGKTEYFQNIRSKRIWVASDLNTRTNEDGSLEEFKRLKGPNYYTSQQIKDTVLKNPEKWKKVSAAEAKPLWDGEFKDLPDTSTSKIHMITGAILPIWDRLPRGETKIFRTQTNEGERLLGRVIPETMLNQTLENFGVGVEKIKMKGKDIARQVLDYGSVLRLSNGWRIKRSKVSGEQRLELTGPGWGDTHEIKKAGVFDEIIGYQTRYFIPKTSAASIIDELIEYRDIVSLKQGYTGPAVAELSVKAKEGREITEEEYRDPHLLIESRINNKYEGILDIKKDIIGELYEKIDDYRLSPKALKKHLMGIKNKDLPEEKNVVKSVIADSIGELIETYKYEGYEEGKRIEDYLDSLLKVLGTKPSVEFDVKEQLDLFTKKEPKKDMFGQEKQKVKEKKIEPKAVFGQKMTPKGKKKPETPTSKQLDLFGEDKKQIQTTMFDIKDPVPFWYSQMENVLEQKLPGKGTPESMKQAINAFAKKGEFKKDEMEWSGVNEWLDNFNETQAKKEYTQKTEGMPLAERLKSGIAKQELAKQHKATKQQVLDYLKDNNVRIQEVTKGDRAIVKKDQEARRRMVEISQELNGLSVPYVSGRPLRWMIKDRSDTPIDVPKEYHEELDGIQKIISEAETYYAGERAPEAEFVRVSNSLYQNELGWKIALVEPDYEAIGNMQIDGMGMDSDADPYDIGVEFVETSGLKQWAVYNDVGEMVNEEYFESADGAIAEIESQGIFEHLETSARPKYQQYQEPGGENYKEVLLTLPEKTGKRFEVKQEDKKWYVWDSETKTYEQSDLGTMGYLNRQDAQDRVNFLNKGKEQYTGGHWKEPGVLAHFRMNERTDAEGKSVLFLEEVQSDLHQKGRKEGYKKAGVKDYNKLIGQFNRRMEDKYVLLRFPPSLRITERDAQMTKEEKAELKHLGEMRKKYDKLGTVPDMPFKKSWPMLIIKRAVRMAAEGGFDKIGWTPGEIQIDRYEEALRKNVDEIRYESIPTDGAKPLWEIDVFKDGKSVLAEDEITIDRVEELLGKDIAEKIKNDKGEKLSDQPYRAWRSISGEGLAIGGEGMKSFYDKMLVNEVNKFFNKKKWGKAKVGVGFIGLPDPEGYEGVLPSSKAIDEGGFEIWTLPITPEMKEKALKEGMPMFSVKDKKLSPLAQEYLDMLIAAHTEVTSETDTKDDPYRGLRKEVAERMELNKGLGKPARFEKIKKLPRTVWNLFTRTFEDLDPKQYGGISNVLRLHKEVSTSSRRRASTLIHKIIGGLKPNQYDIFRMEIIIGDMLKDLESGLLTPKDGLPFGFKNKTEVNLYHEELMKSVNADPVIKNALRRRQLVNNKLKMLLVRNGLLRDSVLEDDRYFHHQVMEYRAAKEIGNEWSLSTGTGTQSLTMRKKGWQKARKGSVKEYNTDYFQSEFEVMAQSFAQLETKHTLSRLKGLIDMTAALKLQAKAMEIEWKDFALPDGLTTWQPAPGSAWFKASSLTDKMMMAIQAGEITDPNVIKNVWAKGKEATWIVPNEIAKTLDNFGKGDIADMAIDKFSRTAITAWKKWILINPYRIIKYNLNNMSGDFDIAFAYDPKIMKYFNQARKDLWAEFKGKPLSKELKGELDLGYRQGVIGSGWTMQDIEGVAEALSYDKKIQALTDTKPGFVKRAWKWSADITTYRENILRLAAYRYFKDRIEGGETGIYAASNKEEVDAIQGDVERAAKLARDLIGDYGNISAGGQWLRRHMIPFYSWMEVNAPRYVRLMRNLKHEGEGRGRAVGVVSAKIAWKGTKLAVKATALMATVMLINRLWHPDEEDELSETQRRQMHLILGRRKDGTIMTLRFQGALSDALSWFGGEDITHDIKDVISGKTPITEKAKDAALAPVIKIINGIRPDLKTGAELLSGHSYYPDPFFPRPIRDNIGHVARLFSLNSITDYMTGKPERGGGSVGAWLMNDIIALGVYTSDPGEASFWNIKKTAYEYLDKIDAEKPRISPTNKSNAMYYYKKALKYGDLKAAEKYLKKYIDLGGTRKGMKLSIKYSSPLGMMSGKRRRAFLKTLTEKEKQTLKIAEEWYKETYINPKNVIAWPSDYYMNLHKKEE